jgi:hypothetical protein
MAYQKQTKSDNRRIWKKTGVDPKDGESLYRAVNVKIKKKSFARPIILTGWTASRYMIELFNKSNLVKVTSKEIDENRSVAHEKVIL